MPITQSAKKALRKSSRKRDLNLQRKKKVKTSITSFRKLVESGNIEGAKKALPGVFKEVDKMAKVKYIKKGKANRIKSRLSKKLNASERKA